MDTYRPTVSGKIEKIEAEYELAKERLSAELYETFRRYEYQEFDVTFVKAQQAFENHLQLLVNDGKLGEELLHEMSTLNSDKQMLDKF